MISHKLETIYVHIPRTAGQSIERAYLGKHGLDWNTRQALLLRAKNDDEQGPPFLAHLTAEQYTDYGYIEQDKFDSYYKFATVRNPYDRMISFMRWYDYYDLTQFLTEAFPRIWREEFYFVQPQANYIYDSGRLLVDDIYRFESLDDLELDLRKTNQSEREDNYHKYYTEECKGIVEKCYSQDIEQFNYEF